jgi:hypothetical protein
VRRHVIVWDYDESYGTADPDKEPSEPLRWTLEGSSVWLDHPMRRYDRLVAEMRRAAERLSKPEPDEWREAGLDYAEDAQGASTHGPQITFRRFQPIARRAVLTHVYRWNRFSGVWVGGRVGR